jgi:DNA-binding response OmpR family regulator
VRGKRILIADDDPNLVDALAVRCRTLGLEVLTAYDARTALNSIFESRPDVACLDVSMPCGNGLGVCEMLVSDERFVSLPVIVLTGRTDPETIRRCHALCAYYVPKCTDLWSRIGPLLRELLPTDCAESQTGSQTAFYDPRG